MADVFTPELQFGRFSSGIEVPTVGAPYRTIQTDFVGGGNLKSLLLNGTSTNTAPSNAATRYTPLVGGGSINAMWNSSSSLPYNVVPCAGTFSNGVARAPVALGAGTSWAFTLYKNGAPTALTMVINDVTGLVVFDSTHTVSVIQGDLVCWQSAPSGTPNAQTVVQLGVQFTAANGQQAPMFAAWTQGSLATGYGAFGNLNSSVQSESSRRSYMPCAGSFNGLIANVINAPGIGQSRTVTLMKNGVDVLSVTIADSATVATVGGTVNYNTGDLIQLRKDVTAGAAASATYCSSVWTPATAGEIPLWSPGTGNYDGVTTLFSNLESNAENTEVTESNCYNIFPVPASLTKFRADMAVAPGVGKSRLMTVRKNSADTAAAVNVIDANTTGSYAGAAVAIAAGDLVDWSEVPTGGPAATNPLGTSSVIVVP